MVAIDLIGEHQSNNIWANIRRCLNSNPKLFYPLKEKGEGWWGLVSYKDELNERDLKIMELQAEVKTLKSRPTVEDFVKKLVKVTKLLFKIHRNHAVKCRVSLFFSETFGGIEFYHDSAEKMKFSLHSLL